MDGTSHLFLPFTAALNPGARVRTVRYPVDEPLGYEALASVARSALPPDEPFILLGESFSGPIAVMLAAEGHAQLKGLVLCCTFVRNPLPWLARLRALIGVLPFGGAPLWVMDHLLLGKFATQSLRAALALAVGQVAPGVMRARLRAVVAVDVAAQFGNVRVPCLYLQAAHDRLVPPEAASLIAALKPDTQVVRVNAPHCLLQAAPADAAAAVEEFSRQVQRAG